MNNITIVRQTFKYDGDPEIIPVKWRKPRRPRKQKKMLKKRGFWPPINGWMYPINGHTYVGGIDAYHNDKSLSDLKGND